MSQEWVRVSPRDFLLVKVWDLSFPGSIFFNTPKSMRARCPEQRQRIQVEGKEGREGRVPRRS